MGLALVYVGALAIGLPAVETTIVALFAILLFGRRLPEMGR
jgi:hypothetical protein